MIACRGSTNGNTFMAFTVFLYRPFRRRLRNAAGGSLKLTCSGGLLDLWPDFACELLRVGKEPCLDLVDGEMLTKPALVLDRDQSPDVLPGLLDLVSDSVGVGQ